MKKKYDTKEVGARKYVVSHYPKYQMVDESSVKAQSYDLEKIIHEVITKYMSLDEQFQISNIIDKLSRGLKYFKNFLCHKKK